MSKTNSMINAIYKYAFLVLFLTSMITLIALKYISSNLKEYDHNYRENLKELKIEALVSEQSESYNIFIKQGNAYLERDDIDKAMMIFLDAKKINPQGKRANLGLTKCLLIQCKRTERNCKMADQYYDLMLQSDLLSVEEKVILSSLLEKVLPDY